MNIGKMMNAEKNLYVRLANGSVYGPATLDSLVNWAKEGRVDPSSHVSRDRINWKPAQLMPELEMKWLVETEPGRVFGPFNREVVSRLFKDQATATPTMKAYRLHEFPIDQDPPPVEVEKIVEKIVEKEVRVEVPVEVEKIVEKEVRVEVPVEVEKIVEKIVEKEVRVEVPVEKIVEKVIEVLPPARQDVVVQQASEPAGGVPPVMPPGSIFGNLDRAKLAQLESAAQRELSRSHRFGVASGLFGRRK